MVGPIIQLAFGSWRLLGALCYRPGAQCPRLKSLSPALTVPAGYQAAHTLWYLVCVSGGGGVGCHYGLCC